MAKEKSDKMAKPSKSVRAFNFPSHNVVIQAENIKEANKKLDKLLTPKSKDND